MLRRWEALSQYAGGMSVPCENCPAWLSGHGFLYLFEVLHSFIHVPSGSKLEHALPIHLWLEQRSLLSTTKPGVR